ncbi:type II toxin-antitoxin system HicB family antitoxin [bacterium]|nr:type II toxin-antitoxin system HicB family antitoxin [bacterium]
MKKIILTGEIWKENNMYTSYCREIDVASCGNNIEEARKNLREVIEIFLEETSRKGTLKELMKEVGFSLEERKDTLASSHEFQSLEKLEVPINVF